VARTTKFLLELEGSRKEEPIKRRGMNQELAWGTGTWI
jgi:hypothetical protein